MLNADIFFKLIVIMLMIIIYRNIKEANLKFLSKSTAKAHVLRCVYDVTRPRLLRMVRRKGTLCNIQDLIIGR